MQSTTCSPSDLAKLCTAPIPHCSHQKKQADNRMRIKYRNTRANPGSPTMAQVEPVTAGQQVMEPSSLDVRRLGESQLDVGTP